MKRKNILLLIIGLIVFTGAFYGFNEYSRSNKDLGEIRSGLSTTASDLVKKFETDEEAANKQFLPKEDFVIEVTGIIREIKKDDQDKYTVVLAGNKPDMSSVQCSMDPQHVKEAASLKTGSTVAIKGVVAGFNADELLGSDVFLSRAIVADK